MEFLNRFSQKSPISKFTDIYLVGATFIHVGRQEDTAKPIGAVHA